jgi:hypothetical protein
MILDKIKIGDFLELQSFDSGKTIFEKVTKIKNEKTIDKIFQIRTENLDFDFTNFYQIVNVI